MNFSKEILRWYDENKRILPWRGNIDPYRIWLSEVIMQQTQIAQGTSYYHRFLERFPSIFEIANADEHDVLMLWQGLGYYSRARNLHHTAKSIVENHKGRFPDNYKDIIALKGIGDYTASMILSVCYNQTYATVDGNVSRLTSRLFGVQEPINKPSGFNRVKAIVQKHISKNRPGDFNQGVMEFGAMFCTPHNPDCSNCIFKKECYALLNDMVWDLPLKEKPKPKAKDRMYYLVCTDLKGLLYIKKREAGIWKGLYEFPLLTSKNKLSVEKVLKNFFRPDLNTNMTPRVSEEIKHLLTHKELCIQFIRLELRKDVPEFLSAYIPVSQIQIFDYPFPVVIKEYLKREL